MSLAEIFYMLLPALHAAGALLAMGLSFGCDTGQAQMTARRPLNVYQPENLPRTTSFIAAWPWDEGPDFETHTWNPFALIFVFEWLTAGFALRPLQYYIYDKTWLLRIWITWLALGLAVFLAWTFTNTGGICPAMLATVCASFLMSAVVAVYSLLRWTGANDDYFYGSQRGDGIMGGLEEVEEEESYKDKAGRLWKVPRTVCMLRRRQHATDRLGSDEDDRQARIQARRMQMVVEYENAMGVLIRYAEYCITAPLLFLAVVCLLVVDAPAWLFLTGYWLLITCNAIGIALHVCFISSQSESSDELGGVAPFVLKLFFAGPW